MQRKFGMSLLVLLVMFGFQGIVSGNAVRAQSTATASCMQVGGTFLLDYIDQTTAIAVVTGDLQGAVRGVVVKSEAGDKGLLKLSTEHTITTTSGDLVRTTDQSELIPVQDKTFLMTQTQKVAGGTGRFAHATGMIKEFGAVDMATGQGVLRYSGEICTNAQ